MACTRSTATRSRSSTARPGTARSSSWPVSLYFSDFCLIVNHLRLRFTDESVGCIDEHNAERGCQQPHGCDYVVFDERIRRERIDVDLMGIPGIEATRVPDKLVQLRELGASIVTADTPDELAAAAEAEFGVPAANMADTLRTFNRTTDPIHELDPPRSRDHAPIKEAPLRAIACVSGIPYTMGGLEVDADMRVPGERLDGVFAAGADAGNVFEDVYGGGLGWAAVPGRRAGRSAVAHATAGKASAAPADLRQLVIGFSQPRRACRRVRQSAGA